MLHAMSVKRQKRSARSVKGPGRNGASLNGVCSNLRGKDSAESIQYDNVQPATLKAFPRKKGLEETKENKYSTFTFQD